jgi:nucleotide sugar dehydrogenase
MLKELIDKKEKIAIIGMGYVGLPLAVAFAEKGMNVIGFDINEEKINKYINGEDPTNEVGKERLKKATNLSFTSDEKKLNEAKFIIVAVPTPVLKNKMPDLRPVIGATELVGRNLKKGAIVVYESTVYPGVTEEVCLPILEKESSLNVGEEFKIGYSPERINPGDKKHRVENIVKITSGMDEESAEIIAEVYGEIIKAGVHKATSIKVAEAAKVIENSQRDINIAFVNELALIFDKIGIDTLEVLEAASTKWNFLQFKPGLVGGHCIGVDPYYLANKAEELGYHAEVILSGRKTNDNMGKFIAEKTIKKLIEAGKVVKNSHVLIMGLTFKENCPDLRNSKVEDIIKELKEYSVNISVTDPLANKVEAIKEYGVNLEEIDNIKKVDAVIIAVSHNEYKELNIKSFKEKFKDKDNMILMDVKGILNKEDAIKEGYKFWRL